MIRLLIADYLWRCILRFDASVLRASGCKNGSKAGNSGIFYGMCIWSYNYCRCIREEYYPRPDFCLPGSVYFLYWF